MQYIQTIFENENIRSYVESNEALVDLAAKVVASYRAPLTQYVQENLIDFVDGDDLASTYENIKSFIIAENLYLMETASEILADVTLSAEETASILEASFGQKAKEFASKHKKKLIAGGLAAGAAGGAYAAHKYGGVDYTPGYKLSDKADEVLQKGKSIANDIKSYASKKIDDVSGKTMARNAEAMHKNMADVKAQDIENAKAAVSKASSASVADSTAKSERLFAGMPKTAKVPGTIPGSWANGPVDNSPVPKTLVQNKPWSKK